MNEICLFSFKRPAHLVKKWSVDVLLELYKQGSSDFIEEQPGKSSIQYKFPKNTKYLLIFSLRISKIEPDQILTWNTWSETINLSPLCNNIYFLYNSLFNKQTRTTMAMSESTNSNSELNPQRKGGTSSITPISQRPESFLFPSLFNAFHSTSKWSHLDLSSKGHRESEKLN